LGRKALSIGKMELQKGTPLLQQIQFISMSLLMKKDVWPSRKQDKITDGCIVKYLLDTSSPMKVS
jgi:hypothetical protein